ncbi:MAG TPA: hypothetical protein VIE65_23785 [Methylobacter sp.]|jgi:hypothetical protein
MRNPLDDFLESELESLRPQAVTINEIIDAISRKRVYDALERLRADGKVKREPMGKENAYKITPIIPERRI